ncbi:MAG: hypothetical protein QXX57_00345 [Nitrososphaerota archaeon]
MKFKVRDWFPLPPDSYGDYDHYVGFHRVAPQRVTIDGKETVRYYIDTDKSREKYGKNLLPAENCRFRLFFRGRASGSALAAWGNEGFFLLCIGDGEIIRHKSGALSSAHFEKEYQRFIIGVKLRFTGYPVDFISRPTDIVIDTMWGEVSSIYHVVYDSEAGPGSNRLVQDLSRFPFNRFLGKVASDNLTGIIRKDIDYGYSPVDPEQMGYEVEWFAYIPVLWPTLNQGYFYDQAVEELGEDGKLKVSFVRKEKPVYFKIPRGAQLKLFFLENYQGLGISKEDELTGIRVLRGGFSRSDTRIDEVTGEKYYIIQDDKDNIRIHYSKLNENYPSDRKIAISASDPGAGRDGVLIEVGSGKKILFYEKSGERSSSSQPKEIKGVAPADGTQGASEPGIWATVIHDIGDQGGQIKFETENKGSNIRREKLVVPGGRHHVVIEDAKTDSLWVFYWKESRLKYPDKKRQETEKYKTDEEKRLNALKVAGLNVYEPKPKPDSEPKDPINLLIHTSEVEYDNAKKPVTVSKGSLFVKRLSISGSSLLNDKAPKNSEQAEKDPPAEDYLVIPIPRDDSYDLPEQVVGVNMTSSGVFVISFVDDNQEMNYYTVQATDKGVKLKSSQKETIKDPEGK